MNLDTIIQSLNALSQMGIVTILLLFIGALGFYLYKENEYKKNRDELLDKLEESLERIATSYEQQTSLYREQLTWMKDDVEHYRNGNTKCKDDLLVGIKEIKSDIKDIKIAVISSK